MSERNTLTLERQVTSYEVDAENRLRPQVLLQWMQEAGDRHAAREGVTYESALAQDCLTLISRSALQLYRLPQSGEAVQLTTLHRAYVGARMLRDFVLCAGNELLAESTNEYFCVSKSSRRPIRPTLYQQAGFTEQDYIPGNPQPKKIVLPETMAPAGERIVYDSFVDRNGHLNNTWYSAFALDACTAQERSRPLRRLFLQFQREAMPGAAVTLKKGSRDGTVWVHGTVGETDCFTAELQWDNKPEAGF